MAHGSGLGTIGGWLAYGIGLSAMREDIQVDGHQMAYRACQNEEVPYHVSVAPR